MVKKRVSVKGAGAGIFFGDNKNEDASKAEEKHEPLGEPIEPRDGEERAGNLSDGAMIRRTFYMSQRADILLDEIRLKLKRTGKTVTKSELVTEAINLLDRKYFPKSTAAKEAGSGENSK